MHKDHREADPQLNLGMQTFVKSAVPGDVLVCVSGDTHYESTLADAREKGINVIVIGPRGKTSSALRNSVRLSPHIHGRHMLLIASRSPRFPPRILLKLYCTDSRPPFPLPLSAEQASHSLFFDDFWQWQVKMAAMDPAKRGDCLRRMAALASGQAADEAQPQCGCVVC